MVKLYDRERGGSWIEFSSEWVVAEPSFKIILSSGRMCSELILESSVESISKFSADLKKISEIKKVQISDIESLVKLTIEIISEPSRLYSLEVTYKEERGHELSEWVTSVTCFHAEKVVDCFQDFLLDEFGVY